MVGLFLLGSTGTLLAEKASILILGSSFYNALPHLDPVYKEKINSLGYEIGQGVYEETNWDKLKRFNVVVLSHHPFPYRGIRAYEKFLELIPLFDRFLTLGGGIFVTDSVKGYAADSRLSINQFLKNKGAEILPERIREKERKNVHIWSAIYGGFGMHAILTREIDRTHPVGKGIREIYYPWLTNSIKVREDWKIVVRGGSTTSSESYPQKPPILAVREWKKGRIVLFPSVDSCWTLEGYGPKWGGFLWENGDGFRLFVNIYRWLAEPSLKEKTLGGFVEKEQDKIYPFSRLEEYAWVRKVPPSLQSLPRRLYKCLIGPEVKIDELEEFALKAKQEGYSIVVPLVSNFEEFKKVEKMGKKLNTPEFLLLPGIKFKHRENTGIVVGGKLSELGWPPGNWKSPSFLAGNVGAGAYTIWINPKKNPWSPWNIGAIGGVEVIGYDENLSLIENAKDLYFKLTRYDWFVDPVVIKRIKSPEKLKEKGFDFYLLLPSLEEDIHSRLFHHRLSPLNQRLTSSFLSNGPLVRKFFWRGKGYTCDVWEGEYYLWFDSEDVARIEIEVSSPAKLKEIRLWEDGRIRRRFYPEGKSFSTTVYLRSDHTSRNYLLEVEDVKGGYALSSPLRTRSIYYWAHGGADRMNTYSNISIPDERGDWNIHGKRYTSLVCPSFDLGWGNPFSVTTPPKESYLIFTRGIETGGPPGGLGRYQWPPFLDWVAEKEGAKKGFCVGDIGRVGYEISSRDCALLEDKGIKYLVKEEGLEPPQKFNLSQKYTIYRFKPHSFMGLLIESTLFLKKGRVKVGEEIPFFSLNFKNYAGKMYRNLVVKTGSGVKRSKINLTKISESLTLAGIFSRGDFVGLYHDAYSGNAALYFLDENKFLVKIEKGPKISLKLKVDKLPEDKITTKILIVYTSGREKPDGSLFKEIQEKFGMGTSPGYKFNLSRGRLLKGGYPLVLEARNNGVKINLKKTDLPNFLPVEVRGINPNWTSGVYDFSSQKFHPLGLLGERMYTVVDLKEDKDLYWGNILILNRPEVIAELVEETPTGSLLLRLHNPLNKKVRVRVEAPVLTPKVKQITLTPGEVREILLERI